VVGEHDEDTGTTEIGFSANIARAMECGLAGLPVNDAVSRRFLTAASSTRTRRTMKCSPWRTRWRTNSATDADIVLADHYRSDPARSSLAAAGEVTLGKPRPDLLLTYQQVLLAVSVVEG